VVSLRPITDANREAVEALAVTPDQGRFVSGVRESMLEAAQEPEARALCWAIYAVETPVGFVMIADEVGGSDYIAHYLWKLLIDERFQRRGLGTAALDLIVEYFRERDVGTMWTSAAQGEGSPINVLRAVRFRPNRRCPRRRDPALPGDLLAPTRATSRRASNSVSAPSVSQRPLVDATNLHLHLSPVDARG
jgi:diamine N-acetyltransferase